MPLEVIPPEFGLNVQVQHNLRPALCQSLDPLAIFLAEDQAGS